MGARPGSFAAGYMSGGKVEYGLVPLGALGLTIFAALLGRDDLSFEMVAVLLGLLGFSGGLFIVPITALLQAPAFTRATGRRARRSELDLLHRHRGLVGDLLCLQRHARPDATVIFGIIAIVTLASTVYAMVLVPDSFMRLCLWLLTHTLYRVRVVGPRKHSGEGWCAAGEQSHVLHGRVLRHRLHGPAHPLHHVSGHL